jgi:hypothetical protein
MRGASRPNTRQTPIFENASGLETVTIVSGQRHLSTAFTTEPRQRPRTTQNRLTARRNTAGTALLSRKTGDTASMLNKTEKALAKVTSMQTTTGCGSSSPRGDKRSLFRDKSKQRSEEIYGNQIKKYLRSNPEIIEEPEPKGLRHNRAKSVTWIRRRSADVKRQNRERLRQMRLNVTSALGRDEIREENAEAAAA